MPKFKQFKSKSFSSHEKLCDFVNDVKNNVQFTDTMFVIHNGHAYVLFYF